jgi:hypothetical protein
MSCCFYNSLQQRSLQPRKEEGNKFKGGILVFRNEKDIAPIIEFIASYRLTFEKV